MTLAEFDPDQEFDHQVHTLLERGYPALSGLTKKAFVERLAPLKEAVLARADVRSMLPPTEARVPFLVVV